MQPFWLRLLQTFILAPKTASYLVAYEHRANLPFKCLGHHQAPCMLGRPFQVEHAINGAPSLLNNMPLKQMIQQYVKFAKIDEQIRRGHLKALSISCSCYQNKQSIAFFKATAVNPGKEACGKAVYVEHLLASSAIPLVFPSIEIKRKYLGDGTVHQHAPLSTPIHLGAEKILVISLDSQKKVTNPMNSHPSAAALTSHLLETLFSDMLHTDLERFQRINEAAQKLDDSAQKQLDFRNIDVCVIRPSQDLSRIAQDYFTDMPKAVRVLCKMLGLSVETAPNLISYLLFEASYCRKLIQLGYDDAVAQKQDILALISN